MEAIIAVGVAIFMLSDTFFMWCLLRASALYEQEEMMDK